ILTFIGARRRLILRCRGPGLDDDEGDDDDRAENGQKDRDEHRSVGASSPPAPCGSPSAPTSAADCQGHRARNDPNISPAMMIRVNHRWLWRKYLRMLTNTARPRIAPSMKIPI